VGSAEEERVMPSPRARHLALAAALAACCGGLAARADAQDRAEPVSPRGVRLTFDDKPVVAFGDAVRLELGARLQADVRADDTRALADGAFAWGHRRVEVAGRVTRRVHFEVSNELGADRPWRDVFVDVRASRALAVQAGRFKVPFSHERLRSGGRLDFVHRSYAADRLAPGRQNGAAVHGRLGRRLEYDAGAFGAGFPEYVALDPATRGLERQPLVAGRLAAQPFRDRGDRDDPLRPLQLGLAVLRGRSLPMLTTLGVRTHDARDRLFPAVYVNGPRAGIGTEARWASGPVRVAAEWIRLEESREGQALDATDLPALVAQGWYVSGVYRVARWRHRDAHWLASALLREVELAARLERIRFGTGRARDGATIVHPRAASLPVHALGAVTVGATWRLNTFGRIQGNVIAEQPDTPLSATTGERRHWSSVVRLQVEF
jgi:phosphate-selective porin